MENIKKIKINEIGNPLFTTKKNGNFYISQEDTKFYQTKYKRIGYIYYKYDKFNLLIGHIYDNQTKNNIISKIKRLFNKIKIKKYI